MDRAKVWRSPHGIPTTGQPRKGASFDEGDLISMFNTDTATTAPSLSGPVQISSFTLESLNLSSEMC